MKYYIVCDLDDCLVKTDVLYEQWLVLLKTKPLLFLVSLFWLFRGLPYFKTQLAQHAPLSAQQLPYREDVVNFLKTAKTDYKNELILASASPDAWVQDVARHLGIFDRAFGSTSEKNLKGSAKLAAIHEAIGTSPFTYIGDHCSDLAIWTEANEIVAVNPNNQLCSKIKALGKTVHFIYDKKRSTLKLLLKQIRPHQWIKNALVFLPAFAAHKLLNFDVIINCLYAFAGFSLAASFVYTLNDILDLRSDRSHHSKKHRPFASGDLSIQWGLLLLPALLIGTALFATLLPAAYWGWIATYLILNLAYSFYLKQSIVVDIIILSMMYTLRIFAGSAATSVPVSEWLLSFSTLFFFSLACVKRCTELMRSKNKITLDGRGYRSLDHAMIQNLGVGSGLLSILIVLLYLQSTDVRSLYSHSQNLWFATPILLFWISRVWILTNRDEIHDDPVVFAVKDKVSWLSLAIMGVVFWISA